MKHTSPIKCPHCGISFEQEAETCQETTGWRKHLTITNCLMAGGAAVALPCVAATAVGFGSAGIVGGSLAAAMQSAIGNVAAGSSFALLQSLGATGTFISGATAGGSAIAVGSGAKIVQHVTNKNRTNEEEGENQEEEETDEETNDTSNEDVGANEGIFLLRCECCGNRFEHVIQQHI